VKEKIDDKVQDPLVLEVSVASNLKARSLAYFYYDIHISTMISMLAALRDLAHWEPVSVRIQEQNLIFCYHGYVPYSTVFKQH